MARLCAAGVTLRNQLNKRFPKRDKRSDGWIGDARHVAETGYGTNGKGSFHNPDPKGIVHAIDVDKDFGAPGDSEKFAQQLIEYCRAGKDNGRIAHVVYRDRVASGTYKSSFWQWRGSGYAHFDHVHISFTNKANEDGSPFLLPIFKDKA